VILAPRERLSRTLAVSAVLWTLVVLRSATVHQVGAGILRRISPSVTVTLSSRTAAPFSSGRSAIRVDRRPASTSTTCPREHRRLGFPPPDAVVRDDLGRVVPDRDAREADDVSFPSRALEMLRVHLPDVSPRCRRIGSLRARRGGGPGAGAGVDGSEAGREGRSGGRTGSLCGRAIRKSPTVRSRAHGEVRSPSGFARRVAGRCRAAGMRSPGGPAARAREVRLRRRPPARRGRRGHDRVAARLPIASVAWSDFRAAWKRGRPRSETPPARRSRPDRAAWRGSRAPDEDPADSAMTRRASRLRRGPRRPDPSTPRNFRAAHTGPGGESHRSRGRPRGIRAFPQGQRGPRGSNTMCPPRRKTAPLDGGGRRRGAPRRPRFPA